MSSRNKGDEKFSNKIKNFLGIKQEKHASTALQKPSTKDFIFTTEILKDIGPESPGNNRIKTIKEISDVVQRKRLEENAIEAVWCCIQDLVLPQTASEKRHAALHFLQCLLEGQYQNLGILRGHFFHVIQGLTVQENLPERLALFKILSENGKNLLEFEEETGPFLLDWMPAVVSGDKVCDFLSLLISVIKYNAAYMDEEIISGLVKQTCLICCSQRSDAEIKLCLDVLDVVVCYSFLPSDSLRDFVSALCLIVNIAKYCEASWELMRKLLGTHLGHSTVFTLCLMLQNWNQPLDFKLLRGAVFFIGMALWGCRKVQFLKHTPAAVLPSFLHVLSCNNIVITHEVTLSVQRLVKKYGKDLTHSTWDIVLNIVEAVLLQIENCTDLSAYSRNIADLHDILNAVEQLLEQGLFSGSITRYFAIVEMCAAKRPESSVVLLISHHAKTIHPGRENWIPCLYQILEKYFRNESRTKVRLKALDVLSYVLSVNKQMYEDDLVYSIVLPHMCRIENETDVSVRKVAMEILLSLAQTCSVTWFLDLIDIVQQVLNRPLVGRRMPPYQGADGAEVVPTLDESHLVDVKATISLLVSMFKYKLYTSPPGMAVKLYDMLVGHLSDQYSNPKDFSSHTASAIRKIIIQCMLNLRADVHHRVGFLEQLQGSTRKYSSYISCKSQEVSCSPGFAATGTVPPSGQWSTVSHLDYTRSFSLFIQCLEKEKDWEVLRCVLDELPLLLQNKTIILSANQSLIDILSSRVCALVNDRLLGYPEKLLGVPGSFTRSDFHTYLFPVLGAMVTYHNFLERNRQRELIKCLEFGMISKCAKLCVNALRLCTLEMQEVMMRLLPSVLLQLSKISATVSMAIPVLAYLSSIVRLPKMYANFVEDEYMSVFAIALPYTNPFKFSHYTVSLAHHVIAIWFIRCRLPFRKGFVQFIQKGLKANVLQQFEENAKLALQNQNQDSSDRARSGSYSEAALRSRRRMQSGSAISRSEVSAPVDKKLSVFHRELTETCTDLMARYTFGNFSPLPHRSNMAEFLLAGGQSQSWLIGNKIITITTSGGGTKAANSGVCEKCQATYQANEIREQRAGSTGRRRHKSAQVKRSHSTVESLQRASQDDSTVPTRPMSDDMALDLGMVGQDVGVQTGSSLSDGVVETEPLESLILGMKNSDLKNSPISVCNCWCTNWAEIYIRAPSGNLSWMMRIENESDISSVQDSQVQDITMLFANMSKQKSQRNVVRQTRRIESGSIGEEEYETLYAQHFPDYLRQEVATIPENEAALLVNKKDEEEKFKEVISVSVESGLPEAAQSLGSQEPTEPSDTHQVSQALSIPSSESAKNHDISPGSLRRSNSSPSILSGSSDTLSPRESISDIVQFGPLKMDNKPKGNDEVAGDNQQCEPTDAPKIVDKPESIRSEENIKSEQEAEKQSVAKSGTREFSSMLTKQLSPSPASSDTSTQDEVGELPTNIRRMRGHTIAVSQPSVRSSGSQPDQTVGKAMVGKDSVRVGTSPSFVFLQLYHSGQIHVTETPYLLNNDEQTERAIKMLDYIYPYETHKIGVIYVGPNQVKDEKAILSNLYGSERYMKFVMSLGNLVRLKDCNPNRVYLGGLNTDGKDGEFTYAWHDESTQLVFHIATLMPNKETDPKCNQKKLHIGNDYVTVVYNDSDEDYKIGVIKGQFNYVNIVIRPLDYDSNAVTLQAKEDIAGILGHTDTKIISDTHLALLIRQIAIHCNMASMVLQRQLQQPQDPFASNWLERLRQIRRMHKNIDKSSQTPTSPSSPSRSLDDFTEYV